MAKVIKGKALSKNIKELVAQGRSQSQAEAQALANARRIVRKGRG